MSPLMQNLDANQVMQWLDRAHIAHYVCGECHGIHFNDLQAMDGILESRLFVEADYLMLFSELEIRPSMLMQVLADVSRMNLNYMHLKIFVDLIDESLPRLVIQGNLPHSAGLSFEQFHLFVENGLQATQALVEECQQLSYVTGNELAPVSSPRSAMH